MREAMMYPVELVFSHWIRDRKSLSGTEEGIDLGMGDFHGGTCFGATITLDPEQAADLRRALDSGATPVFYAKARGEQ